MYKEENETFTLKIKIFMRFWVAHLWRIRVYTKYVYCISIGRLKYLWDFEMYIYGYVYIRNMYIV